MILIATPKLSIVIPTLNEERYLPGLLVSLAGQTYCEFETIVSDAGSTDSTQEIALAAGCKLVVGPRKGPAYGRNAGAKVAQGEILLFLDADVLLPAAETLGRLVGEFSARGLAVATCLSRPWDGTPFLRFLFSLMNAWLRLFGGIQSRAPGWTLLAKRWLHEAIEGFDEAPCLGEDHDYVARMRKHGRFGVLRSDFVLVSTRRFQQDGVFRTLGAYLLFEALRPFRRLRFDEVHYRFGEFR